MVLFICITLVFLLLMIKALPTLYALGMAQKISRTTEGLKDVVEYYEEESKFRGPGVGGGEEWEVIMTI